MQWHPGWEFTVQVLVALGTLGLAAVTLALVLKTKGMVETTEYAFRVSIRPLLADPKPAGFTETQDERLLFGPPGRISPVVQWGKLWWESSEDDRSVRHFSVAFENIGTGPAAVVACRTIPEIPGSLSLSRKFVPVGTLLRVNVSVHPEMPGGEPFKDQWWAMGKISVAVDYTDTDGGELFTSTAVIGQYATQGPFVEKITITRDSDGSVLATGESSY
jgi:hypothetical protein